MIQSIIRHLLIIMIFFISTSALADVNCNDISSPTVQGNITSGDYQQLVKCLVKFTEHGKPSKKELEGGYYGVPVGWVYFNSIGGDVNEAIKIGRFLRQSLAEVAIEDKCYSACFLAVVGSVKLYAGEPFGKVGIHRMFHEAETLKQVDILEYERYYNDAKKKIRLYFLDLDVPTSIVEKMFSIPSSEMYILNHSELSLLNNHPAYEEWISARCPNPLTDEERIKYQDYISSGFKKRKHSDESIENIERHVSEHDKCTNDIRWDQFKNIVSAHYKRLTSQE